MGNKLIMAVMYSDNKVYDAARSMLVGEFGDAAESREYDFDQFTPYYEKEMGRHLVKRFLVFGRFIEKRDLIRIKKKTTETEKEFSEGNKRRINIDPGCLNDEELVLASFKKGTNYKEELGEGVYAHRVLEFKDGEIKMFWHTFPDYRVKENQNFFLGCIHS